MTEHTCSVGILFADISGSMKLYEAFGNRGALTTIERCCAIIAGVVTAQGGRVVKTIGDEVMAAFPDAARTWAAAVDMQGRIEALDPLAAPGGVIKMALRVGFNFGHAIENGDDYFGETVNVAARMVQIAKRGQIITTGEGAASLPTARRYVTRNLDWLPIKGKPDGLQVVEVVWREEAHGGMTIIDIPGFGGPKRAGNDLRLAFGDRHWVCDGTCTSVTIGREPANTVVLAATVASRNHATIERRLDRWVLVDHSSNGTFLEAGGREIHLRHEESILSEAGTISFGAPASGTPRELCLSFEIARGAS